MRLDPRVVQIASEIDPSRRIEQVLDAACSLLRADGAVLALVDDKSGQVQVVRERGTELVTAGVRPAAGNGITRAVLSAGRAMRRAEPDRTGDAPPIDGVGRAWIGAPIHQADSVAAVLSAYRAGTACFSPGDEDVLTLLAALAGGALRETRLLGQAPSARPEPPQRALPSHDVTRRTLEWLGEQDADPAHRALIDAVESLEDGFLLYDADDRLVLSNRRVLDLVPAVADVIKPGVRFEEVVRAAAARGFYRSPGQAVDEIVAARLTRQMLPDGRIEMHLDDGRTVQVKETRTRDRGRLILVTDVTELRRTTAALQVSERNYRLMVDGVDDIMYRTDANGHFTFVNPRVEELLGWTAEEIVGTQYLDLIDPAYRAAAGRFYLRQFGRHIPTTYYEFPAVARDGAVVWVGQHVRLVEEGGEIVGALAVARDITARRRAEAHERDRLRIVDGIARNAPLRETLSQLVGLFERRAPGWRGAVALTRAGGRRLAVAPGWPASLIEVLTESAGQGATGADPKPAHVSDRRGGAGDATGQPTGPVQIVRKLDLAGQTAWSAPIHGRDDGVAGLWAMISDGRREPDAETTLLVPEVVQLAAVAVEHARLTEHLQARIERARTLNHLAQLMSSSLDLETVLGEIARAASALLDAPVARFWMVDEESQTLRLAADVADGAVEHGPNRVNIADLRGVLGWVVANRQPVMIPNAIDDPRVRDGAWWAERGLTSFLGQPVLLDGRLLAVLVLWGRESFAFDADDEALLESFIAQAALSIRNAQLYLDTDQQRRRLQSLVEVSHRLSRGLDLTEVLDAITEAAAAIFAGEAGLRLLVGDELVRASVSRGARQRPSMERITTVGGLIELVLRSGQPASTSDVTSERRIATNYREILQQDRMTALLVAPIRHDGRVLGTLHIYRERGHEWGDDAHLLAAGLADQAAMAIENATRYAGLQESLERARIPARVNQLLSAALDLDVLLREIASAAVTITGATVASLWLADEEARTLTLAVFSDETIGAGRTIRRLAFGQGRAGWVAVHRRPLIVDDVFTDPRTTEPDWWRRHGLSSACSLPILDGDRLVAVLSIDGQEPIQIGDESRDLLNALGAQTAAALRNAALYREVSAANRRLEQEVRRNELLLNSVADGVFGVDGDGLITFVNPAALRMLGFAAGDLLGQDADARLHHPDGHSPGPNLSACPFERAIRQGQAYRTSEDTLWQRDGQSIPVECVLTPLFQDGASVGAVVTFRDIRREKETERQRRALAQSEKLRALGQLAGGVAHDLNQSLGLVVGHSELALEAIKQTSGLPEELHESLETIMQGALDGAETVKRLQTFVRGHPEGEAERIAIGDLLADVARLTAPRWRDAAQAAGAPVHVSVNVQMSSGDEVMGWPASLREALTNLVFNALDAMPGGGDLQLTARGIPGQIVVEVTDTGSGMPPGVAARVFEPFFTTKGERGTGLGLAMVYGIVERHSGRIEVDSEVGRGTTIRIILPRALGGVDATTGEGELPANRPRSILIVDDEAALRRMLTRMLQIDGHTVVAAATAAEALHHLRKQKFDLVLSDHGLGVGMNGLELATAVRDLWPGTRFILVTGWGGSIDPAEVEPLGVEAVIGKPYRAPELREHINARP